MPNASGIARIAKAMEREKLRLIGRGLNTMAFKTGKGRVMLAGTSAYSFEMYQRESVFLPILYPKIKFTQIPKFFRLYSPEEGYYNGVIELSLVPGRAATTKTAPTST